MLVTKLCGRCREDKPFSAFNKCKGQKSGFHSHCRECQKVVRRAWYLKHQKSEQNKASTFAKTPEGGALRARVYWKNRIKILARNRIRRKTEHARRLARKQRNRWMQKLENRLACNLRSRIRLALKGVVKSDTTLGLLGCSIDKFKRHIEAQFTEGMSWKNYTYRGWHIDHIVPCAAFDLSKSEEHRKCFHYTNLRPLWWVDNLAKNSKLYTDFN